MPTALAGFNQQRPGRGRDLLAVDSNVYVSHKFDRWSLSLTVVGEIRESMVLSQRLEVRGRKYGVVYAIAGSAAFSNGHGLPSR